MYEKCTVAIDPVIVSIIDKKIQILLNKREKEPFDGKYELPGGLLQENESAEDILERKLQSITNKEIFFTQFHTFTKPDRDPRQRTISIGYIAIVPAKYIHNQDKWFDSKNLPKLAFDHKELIEKGLETLKTQLNELLAKQFLPNTFPLNALQDVYETIQQTTYDNRNFRRKMLQSKIIRETEEYETNVSHRPAKLFEWV